MLGRLLRIFGPAVGYRIENRRLLGLMYLAGLFQGYAQTQAVNTLPFARITFDLTAADMSRLFAVTRIGALLAVAYAAFSDRWGRRGPFLVAFLTLLVANGITAAAFSTSLYAAFQMMARMGSAAMAMLAAVLVAEQVRWNNRAWAIGLYSAAVALGSGAGLLALPVAHMHDQGWRLLFGASILGLPLYLLLRSKVPESRVFRFTERPLRFTPPLVGRYSGRFWLVALYSLSISVFSAVAITFSLERLVNDLGNPSIEAARILLIGGTVGGIGFFLGGRIADSLGRKPTLIVTLILGLAGGVGFYWFSSPGLLMAATALSAFGSSAALPISAAQRTEMFPTSIRAVSTQWIHAVAVLGSILGLYVAGHAIDRWGLHWTVTGLGSAVVLAVLIQTVIPETLGNEMGHTKIRT